MYSTWAIKQRSKILLASGVIAFILLSLYVTVGLYEPPSCFDNEKNQDEIGVDCGGTCALMCASQTLPLKTLWTRSFEVSKGIWSALAYIENPNPTGYVPEAYYRFSLYDRDGALITKKEDSTFITHDAILPVFTGRIQVNGEKVPYRTEFEWIGAPVWVQNESAYTIALEEQTLTDTATHPRLEAILVSKEPTPLNNIEVVAIVHDANKNAIAVSKTYVDRLTAYGKRRVVFSWPHPFVTKAERWELAIRIPVQPEE